jgi:hypothetical protein
MNLAKNMSTAKIYGEQAIALDKKITLLASRIMQDPNLKKELEKYSQEKTRSTAVTEGFQALKSKLEQKQLTAYDMALLSQHIQGKVYDSNRLRNQEFEQSR